MDLSFVAFDLDGTVFRSVGVPRVAPRVQRALAFAHDAGLPVICASGRPWSMTGSMLRRAPWLDWQVGMNGADVTDNAHEHVIMRPLPEACATEILTEVRHPHCFWNVGVPEAFYFEIRRGRFLLNGPLTHLKINKWDRRGPMPRCYHVTRVNPYVLPNKPILKMDLVAPGAALQERVVGEINAIAERHGGLEVAVMSYGIELTAKGVTKATSLRMLLERLGVDLSKGVVFGDSANDYSLTGQEWTFVAMGNASPEILAVADDVTDSVFDDGVATWLERALEIPGSQGRGE